MPASPTSPRTSSSTATAATSIERPYGVVDNAALRAHLDDGVDVRRDVRDERVRHSEWGSRVVTDAGDVDARIVVEAAGFPPMLGRAPPPAANQTAYGVVVGERPSMYADDDVVLMDLRPAARRRPSDVLLRRAGRRRMARRGDGAGGAPGGRGRAAPRTLLGVRVGDDGGRRRRRARRS